MAGEISVRMGLERLRTRDMTWQCRWARFSDGEPTKDEGREERKGRRRGKELLDRRGDGGRM